MGFGKLLVLAWSGQLPLLNMKSPGEISSDHKFGFLSPAVGWDARSLLFFNERSGGGFAADVGKRMTPVLPRDVTVVRVGR